MRRPIRAKISFLSVLTAERAASAAILPEERAPNFCALMFLRDCTNLGELTRHYFRRRFARKGESHHGKGGYEESNKGAGA
jgi:hypothetical protein